MVLELYSDHFPGWLHWPKGPTVWLDGSTPPSLYRLSNYMSLINSKIWWTHFLWVGWVLLEQRNPSLLFLLTKILTNTISF